MMWRHTDTLFPSLLFSKFHENYHPFAYLIIMFNPSWTKAVFFFEGIIIAVSGYMLLAFPYNLELLGVGLIVIIIAVLAYLGKLPPKLLKWFYR